MTPGLPLPERRPADPALPMINVVFLLLVFFLIAATLAPPAPLAVEPPTAEGTPARPGATLHLSADGTAALGDLRGEEAIAAAIAAGPVTLRADAAAEARAVAGLLARIAAGGGTPTLVVRPGP
ncbi:MAG: biopolymer transporter ExbD [Hasllibacter sp.]